MTSFLLLVFLLFANADSLASDGDLECEKIKRKISKIESKMRSGYTRAEGEKLAAELRRLRSLRRQACR